MKLAILIIREAIKAVPATRYALGIAGIVAVIAIIQALKVDFKIAVFGVVIMLILMTVLIVFARLSALGHQDFRLPAIIFIWFSLLLVIACATLLFASVFFPGRIPNYLNIIPSSNPPKIDPQENDNTQADASHNKEDKASGAEESQHVREMIADLNATWVYQETSKKEVFDDPVVLGRCIVETRRESSMDLKSMATTLVLNGSFTAKATVTAVYTPSNLKSQVDIALGDCNKSATGDSMLSERTVLIKGDSTAKPNNAEGTKKIAIITNITSCKINQDDCPTQDLGEKEPENVEFHGKSVIKIGPLTFIKQ